MTKNALLLAWGLAILPNTLEAFGGGSDDTWWQVVRFGLSTLFVITLVAFAIGRVRRG